MSDKLFSMRRRLRKLERALANSRWREKLVHCNCSTVTMAIDPDKFEAEMNLSCPAHGFRQLGLIVHVEPIGAGGSRRKGPGLDQLLATYEARARQARLDRIDKDDDFEEI
jgi:hypothetical protein